MKVTCLQFCLQTCLLQYPLMNMDASSMHGVFGFPYLSKTNYINSLLPLSFTQMWQTKSYFIGPKPKLMTAKLGLVNFRKNVETGEGDTKEAYLIININSLNSKQFDSFLSLAMSWVLQEAESSMSHNPIFLIPRLWQWPPKWLDFFTFEQIKQAFSKSGTRHCRMERSQLEKIQHWMEQKYCGKLLEFVNDSKASVVNFPSTGIQYDRCNENRDTNTYVFCCLQVWEFNTLKNSYHMQEILFLATDSMTVSRM